MSIKGKCVDVVGKCIKGILDCMENCVGSMSFVAGQRIVKVLLVAVFMLIFSLMCQTFGVWTIVSWQEAACCVAISGVLTLFDESGRKKISRMVKEVQDRGDKRK